VVVSLAFIISERVQAAYYAACTMDVAALKPGNVSVDAPGHGMTAADFLRSAEASSPMIVAPFAGLGKRVRLAVEATRARVGCNTNLGIVLLCVPLAQACLAAPAEATHVTQLRDSLRQVLDAADVADTEQVFTAIRLAAPGGLGTAALHDVNDAARVPLGTAMAEAADRDLIARQYATGFEDVFTVALPALDAARLRSRDPVRGVTDLYMLLLSRFPDTHVRRRHGAAVAEGIRAEAADTYATWLRESPKCADALLRRFDARLKAEGVNPGTTADLTVATLFLHRLLTAAFRQVGGEHWQHTRHLRWCSGRAPPNSTMMNSRR